MDPFPSSTTRLRIWEGWQRHRSDLSATGLKYATLVNGSFITRKLNPGDVDIVVLAQATQLNALDPQTTAAISSLLDPSVTRPAYLCHSSLLLMYDLGHLRFQTWINLLTYWTRVFGIDRKGRHKAIVLVQ